MIIIIVSLYYTSLILDLTLHIETILPRTVEWSYVYVDAVAQNIGTANKSFRTRQSVLIQRRSRTCGVVFEQSESRLLLEIV